MLHVWMTSVPEANGTWETIRSDRSQGKKGLIIGRELVKEGKAREGIMKRVDLFL